MSAEKIGRPPGPGRRFPGRTRQERERGSHGAILTAPQPVGRFDHQPEPVVIYRWRRMRRGDFAEAGTAEAKAAICSAVASTNARSLPGSSLWSSTPSFQSEARPWPMDQINTVRVI